MFIFLNHHHGRTDESAPWSLADCVDMAFHWSSLLDDEWIGMRPVGSHADEVYVFERGPFMNPLSRLRRQRAKERNAAAEKS